MGNSLGGKKTTKVMKISGETLKLKTPVTAEEVLEDYPAGHVLLESEAVKHYGTRAKPLQPQQKLAPKRLYFLVELPNSGTEKVPRRVRSTINMSAKERLESLMLSRRSVSDLTIMKPASVIIPEEGGDGGEEQSGAMRLKMRVRKAELERLMKESRDEAEAAERIVDLCMAKKQEPHWNGGGRHGRVGESFKVPEKRVSFMGISEAGGSQIAVA
ncbi:uncharacterized protein At1g66480-like [Carica papaya]|uniref:uncharacterized protein At1g66480-like n=1 Tax=Carica papaya TaxID=3649 RepID=UPI000B8CAC8E|nr:uncharacterized protein At1g66480-like [Carica papaya]